MTKWLLVAILSHIFRGLICTLRSFVVHILSENLTIVQYQALNAAPKEIVAVRGLRTRALALDLLSVIQTYCFPSTLRHQADFTAALSI